MSGRSLRNVLALAGVAVVVACATWCRSGDLPTTGADAKLPRLVDIGSTECDACKELAPILEELREEYEGRLIVEFIDVFEHPAAQDEYDVIVIPKQVLIDAEGNRVWEHEGFISKEDLKAVFAQKVGVE